MAHHSQNFRSLLPRGEPVPVRESAFSSRVVLSKAHPRTVGACESCRQRKSKCNGARPQCYFCAKHGSECHYLTRPSESRVAGLKRRYSQLEAQVQGLLQAQQELQALIRALKSLDDTATAALLQEIRRGTDLASLLQRMSTSNGLLQLCGASASAQDRNPSQDGQVVVSQDAQAAAPVTGREANTNGDGDDDDDDNANNHNSSSSSSSMTSSHDRHSPQDELLDLLRSCSEADALTILQHIRHGHSVTDTLQKAKTASLLPQVRLVPEMRRRYQFPYRSGFPAFLVTPDNPYLDLVHQITVPTPAFAHDLLHTSSSALSRSSAHHKPFHAAEIADPYLWSVKASRWTNVTDDDRLVSKLLSSYFLHQYPIFMGFHKDYFLEDMAKNRSRFCSPLLVNTLLAAGCHTSLDVPDRAQFWKPQGLAYQFLAEAKRLWEVQGGKSSLTAIQAAIVLNTIYNSDTMDKAGRLYMLQAAAMAHDLELFKASPSSSSSSSSTRSTTATTGARASRSNKMERARAFTAWSLYTWDSLHSFYYRLQPLFTAPPASPLPDIHADPAWYGEIWVRYPLDDTPTPTHFGHVAQAIMKFRYILHDVADIFFGVQAQGQPVGTASLAQLLHYRAQLHDWFRALPAPLRTENILLPSHIRLHGEYYTTLITLVQAQCEPTPPGLAPETAPGLAGLPDGEMVARAYTRVETLVRLYHLRHNCEFYDAFLMFFLFLLGNRTLDVLLERGRGDMDMLPDPRLANNTTTTTTAAAAAAAAAKGLTLDEVEMRRSTLILCARGLRDQGKNSYLPGMVYLVLRDRMPARERNLLLTYVDDNNDNNNNSQPGGGQRQQQERDRSIAAYNQSCWPLPIIKINEDPRTALLGDLAREYESLSLEATSASSSPGRSAASPDPEPEPV